MTAYVLLTLQFPFEEQQPADLVWGTEGETLSLDCRNFVASLLRLQPTDRLCAGSALGHPWLTQTTWSGGDQQTRLAPQDEEKVFCSLLQFRTKNPLEKAAANFAASHLSAEKLHELTQMFQAVDVNGDGTLDKDELEGVLHGLADRAHFGEEDMNADTIDALDDVMLDSSKLAALMASLDADGSGRITYSEFLATAAAALMQDSVYLAWEAFKAFDLDGNGVLQKAELVHVLRTPEMEELLKRIQVTAGTKDYEAALEEFGGAPESVEDLMARLDCNDDNRISFEEFSRVIFGKNPVTSSGHPVSIPVQERRRQSDPRIGTISQFQEMRHASFHVGHP